MNQADVLNYNNSGSSNHRGPAGGTFSPSTHQSNFFGQPLPTSQPQPQTNHPSDYQARFLEQQRRRQQQQQQQHDASFSYGSNMNGGSGSMQAGLPQQQNIPSFSSHSVPTSAGTPAPGFQAGVRSASSSQHMSQSPSTPGLQQGQQRHPMAAPATPQATSVPQNLQSPSGSVKGASTSQPQSPQSASSQAREKDRIKLLLEINQELLQEVQTLQSQGKGGAQNAQIAQYMKSQGLPDKMASEEYLQTIMRLQANLGYLCGQSDMHAKPGSRAPHPPTFMAHPPNMPGLAEKYAELKKLFPGWGGRDGQMSEQIQAMQAQGQNQSYVQGQGQQANGGAVMGNASAPGPAGTMAM